MLNDRGEEEEVENHTIVTKRESGLEHALLRVRPISRDVGSTSRSLSFDSDVAEMLAIASQRPSEIEWEAAQGYREDLRRRFPLCSDDLLSEQGKASDRSDYGEHRSSNVRFPRLPQEVDEDVQFTGMRPHMNDDGSLLGDDDDSARVLEYEQMQSPHSENTFHISRVSLHRPVQSAVDFYNPLVEDRFSIAVANRPPGDLSPLQQKQLGTSPRESPTISDIDVAAVTNSASEKQFQDLAFRLQEANDKINDQSEHILKMSEREIQLRNELRSLRLKMNDENERDTVETLRFEKARLQDRVDELNSELQFARSQLSQERCVLEEEKVEMREHISALEHRLRSSGSDQDELRMQLNQHRELLQTRESEVERLELEKRSLERQNRDLEVSKRESLNGAQTLSDNLLHQLKEAQRELRAYREEASRHVDEMSRTREELIRIREVGERKVASLEDDLRRERNESHAMRKQLNDLRDEQQKMISVRKQLEQEVSNLHVEIANHQQSRNFSEEDKTELHRDNIRLNEEIRRLKTQLESCQAASQAATSALVESVLSPYRDSQSSTSSTFSNVCDQFHGSKTTFSRGSPFAEARKYTFSSSNTQPRQATNGPSIILSAISSPKRGQDIPSSSNLRLEEDFGAEFGRKTSSFRGTSLSPQREMNTQRNEMLSQARLYENRSALLSAKRETDNISRTDTQSLERERDSLLSALHSTETNHRILKREIAHGSPERISLLEKENQSLRNSLLNPYSNAYADLLGRYTDSINANQSIDRNQVSSRIETQNDHLRSQLTNLYVANERLSHEMRYGSPLRARILEEENTQLRRDMLHHHPSQILDSRIEASATRLAF